ncbi:MAG: hypothetical protein PHP70_10255 [Gallionella sp.]|nr:hypothetical protein [Gallionella sp.]
MKLKSTLLAAMLALFAASTTTVFAAEEHDVVHDTHNAPAGKVKETKTNKYDAVHDVRDVPAGKVEAAKTDEHDDVHDVHGKAAKTGTGETAEPAKKKVKKHSHMEEKTNMPMPEATPHADKKLPEDRHDHVKEKH